MLQDSYILDAGLDAGLELPYTCRGGICGWGYLLVGNEAHMNVQANQETEANVFLQGLRGSSCRG